MTVQYDPSQLAVQKLTMLFVDFNLSAFAAPAYAGQGQQFTIYGTSGIANDPYMSGTYLSMFSENYFVGLLMLFDGQFVLGSMSVDVVNALSFNIFYYNSELLIVSYLCPPGFPITDALREYCYSGCVDGQY